MSEKSLKEARKVTQVRWFHSAEVQGIEPQFAAPKTAVLPLDDTSGGKLRVCRPALAVSSHIRRR